MYKMAVFWKNAFMKNLEQNIFFSRSTHSRECGVHLWCAGWRHRRRWTTTLSMLFNFKTKKMPKLRGNRFNTILRPRSSTYKHFITDFDVVDDDCVVEAQINSINECFTLTYQRTIYSRVFKASILWCPKELKASVL